MFSMAMTLINIAMAMLVDPLVLGGVIGEVVDMFVPTVNMSVHYASKHITNGCSITPSLSLAPPKITISGHPNQLYTLIMIDPDAPSPSEPTLREYLHWIVVDIPGGTNPTLGKELLPYLPPRPPIGIHRYVFVLFHQPGPGGPLDPPLPSTRANFSTRAFSSHMGLGLPVAIVYFNAQKEPACRRRTSSRR